MDRVVIFIDAGHLLAEGGNLCCGTKKRAEIVCKYKELVEALIARVEERDSLKVLRVYWYDGARESIPTSDHLDIARLPRTKLRLGRLSGGKQKGVDALIVRDMMKLAGAGAMATAYLLAGDEDLRIGVVEAQELGVRVVLVGIPPVVANKLNQADTLMRECDGHDLLDKPFLSGFFSKQTATPYQLRGYLAFLEAKKDAGRRSSTLFIAAMAIRQFHRFLKERGHAGADPTQGMRLPRFNQRLPKPLSTAEMERLLAAPAGTGFTAIRDRAMLELMYATGMRVSELTGLRLGQVDLDAGWVRVLGKGSRERLVPFGPRAAAALRSYLDTRAARLPAGPDAVFLNARGRGPMTRGSFAWRLAAAARRAGLSGGVSPHQIRHSCATHMLMGGAELRVISEMLGHSGIGITARYAHVTAELLRQTCRRSHPRF